MNYRVFAAVAALGVVPSLALASEQTCLDAAGMAVEGVTVDAAEWAPAGEDSPVDHCIVSARMAERTGADGNAYAIRFELRLPDAWEGRFLHQFNGGNDGEVKPALGGGVGVDAGGPALARGFAVVSSDAGHDGAAHPESGLVGGNMFGFDFEARRDYGYGAVAKLHPVALEMVTAYYGQAPDYVYGYGGSNGGRHAMVAAERMPGAFDGLLAGFPGFNLPKAAVQHAWDVQNFRSFGKGLADSFTREDLAAASAAILAACDGLDGLEDGVVNDYMGCQAAFDPASMTCTDGQNSACLAPEQTEALTRIHAGPTNSAGEALYNSWYWEPGISGGNWRFWKLESPIPPWGNKPIIAVMGAGSLAQIFSTPPAAVDGTPEALEASLMAYDFDTDAPKIYATSEDFPESPMQVMTPPNAADPTLADYQAAGGKLIVFHGVADPVFSFKDTQDWYDRLAANNPDADDFTRLYAVPGMNHGPSGNAADGMDLMGALIDWVEGSTAPGVVPTAFRADNEEAGENAGAERPLCPYPTHAVYTGGDAASMASFACE
ncbi:MAG: tannase/feruloyl esterase family alpha/beta hydrolase [Maritimibacter sp.]|nr:tannase/feruloyl esterase family alpha/beta hydrolase [Maritimibacter sp.]